MKALWRKMIRRSCEKRKLAVFALALGLCCPWPNAAVAAEHWVGTWGCGPQLTERANLPPSPLAENTLRQFVHVTIGGKRLRARFCNAFGTNSVTLRSVHVALAGGDSAADGAIDADTDKALKFRGLPSVTVQAGETVWSDPFDFDLPPLANLAVDSAQNWWFSATF